MEERGTCVLNSYLTVSFSVHDVLGLHEGDFLDVISNVQ